MGQSGRLAPDAGRGRRCEGAGENGFKAEGADGTGCAEGESGCGDCICPGSSGGYDYRMPYASVLRKCAGVPAECGGGGISDYFRGSVRAAGYFGPVRLDTAAVAEGAGSVLGVLLGGGICVRGVCKRVCHAVRLRGTAACV